MNARGNGSKPQSENQALVCNIWPLCKYLYGYPIFFLAGNVIYVQKILHYKIGL